MSALMIGVQTATKDGTVTFAVEGTGVLINMGWREALTVVRALIQASGTASAIAGVSREDYTAAMLAELAGQQ